MSRPLGIETNVQRTNRQGRQVGLLYNRSSGRWHIVAAAGEPGFLNATTDAGGGWLSTRFRWSLGGGFEYIININPPAVGLACFTLPVGFYETDGDVPVHGFNSAGTSLSFKVVASAGGGHLAGDVVYLG